MLKRECPRCTKLHGDQFATCNACRMALAEDYLARGGDELPELLAVAEAARHVLADVTDPGVASRRLIIALDDLDRARRPPPP